MEKEKTTKCEMSRAPGSMRAAVAGAWQTLRAAFSTCSASCSPLPPPSLPSSAAPDVTWIGRSNGPFSSLLVHVNDAHCTSMASQSRKDGKLRQTWRLFALVKQSQQPCKTYSNMLVSKRVEIAVKVNNETPPSFFLSFPAPPLCAIQELPRCK